MANNSKNSLSNVFVFQISLDSDKKLMTLLEMKPSDLSILEQFMASCAQQSFKDRSKPFLGFDEKYTEGIRKVLNHLSSSKNYTCFNIVYENKKENEALSFLLKKLKENQIYKGEIFSEKESRLASRLLKVQKKLGLSFSGSTLQKEENRGMQAAHLIGESLKANHPKLSRELSKFFIMLLEAETAHKSKEFLKALYKNFDPIYALTDKELHYILSFKEASSINAIAKGMEKGLTIEEIQDILSSSNNEQEIKNLIEQHLQVQKELKSYSKDEFFGNTDENLIHEVLFKEMQGLYLSAAIDQNDNKDLGYWKEQIHIPPLKTQLEEKAKKVLPFAKKEIAGLIEEQIHSFNNPSGYKGRLLAYVNENPYVISALILDETSKKELKSLIGTLIIKYKEIWPSEYSLKWTSVSSRAQEFYEEVLNTVLQHPNVHVIVQSKQEDQSKREWLVKAIEKIYAASHRSKIEFRGESCLLAAIKKENLLKNRLAWYKPAEIENNLWLQLLALLNESFYFFEHNKNTVLKTSKQGKVYIIQNILSLMEKKNEEKTQNAPEPENYLNYDPQLDFNLLSKEALEFLSSANLSPALTKRLAKAFNQGLSLETVYYLQALHLEERSFQLRLRSLVLSYLYSSKKQRFYQELLEKTNYSLEELDFLMNEKWTLSKVEYLTKLLEEGYPFLQLKRNFHTSLSLKKMEMLAQAGPSYASYEDHKGQVVFLMNSFFIEDSKQEAYKKEMIQSIKNKIVAADLDFKYGKTKKEILDHEKTIEKKAEDIFSMIQSAFSFVDFQQLILNGPTQK